MKSLEMSGFAFHSPHNSRALRGWYQSGKGLVAGSLVDGSEDKQSVQLFVVEDCLRS